ncbi:shikimate kinase [Methanococcoides burtonii]|uniref:Shikimate kinase n=1 Tax=Methanococcoides burtonii (strain DSM 6242 / NBRC 107633 / OCM 468 / ACE-M) TaxID=259564 RepID=Q12XP5_METBU|nr:shikimate kinase [Methanococcoides burtonii]ABE51781.1 shikimate kinase [Methanococcoides burtonii DSM 6242]
MNITLIGMSGAGKSTIGKQLAKKLGYKFIDIDDLIRAKIGTGLQTFIDTYGDDEFIGLEEQIVIGLHSMDDHIIATGGSIVYSETAIRHLKDISTIVYLDVPFIRIAQRISPSQRGLVGFKDKGLRDLYNDRKKLYEHYMDIRIKIKKGETKRDIVERIIALCPDDVSTSRSV